MRVLGIHPGPDFSVSDVHTGWVAALRRLGCEVVEYNMQDRLAFYSSARWDGERRLNAGDVTVLASKSIEAKIYEYEPDLLFIISGFFVTNFQWELWRRKRQKMVILFTESPYEDPRQLATVALAEPDLIFVNDPTNLSRYRDGKRHAYYMPHSFDPTVHYPSRTKKTRDFVFIGSGYPSRVELFEQINWAGIDATFAGNWRWLTPESPLHGHMLYDDPERCTYNNETADLYRSARISANLYRAARATTSEAQGAAYTQGWSMGPRELELAACGTFFARESRGEGDMLLPMLPRFSEPEHLEELIRWYLAHPKEREKKAAQARAAVQDRTFDAHARRMLRLL